MGTANRAPVKVLASLIKIASLALSTSRVFIQPCTKILHFHCVSWPASEYWWAVRLLPGARLSRVCFSKLNQKYEVVVDTSSQCIFYLIDHLFTWLTTRGGIPLYYDSRWQLWTWYGSYVATNTSIETTVGIFDLLTGRGPLVGDNRSTLRVRLIALECSSGCAMLGHWIIHGLVYTLLTLSVSIIVLFESCAVYHGKVGFLCVSRNVFVWGDFITALT